MTLEKRGSTSDQASPRRDGGRYRKLREAAGLRQVDVAYLLHVSQRVVSEVETGKWRWLDTHPDGVASLPSLRQRLDELFREDADALRERIQLDRLDAEDDPFNDEFANVPRPHKRGPYKKRRAG